MGDGPVTTVAAGLTPAAGNSPDPGTGIPGVMTAPGRSSAASRVASKVRSPIVIVNRSAAVSSMSIVNGVPSTVTV